ncbi:hypothetical protein [Conexibacter woesei]|uniref:hypothetical protein n=1 Tax=Conexibacter woesei TaxID=191495 RepID=UPI0003FCA01F|nr:hypothetical protein [Conexibacter woesei]
MPERHGLPLIVKFSLLAFCGFLVLGVVGVIVEAAGGGHRRSQPTLAARAESCKNAHGGGPFENLRYPYTALSTRPEYPPLNLDVPADLAADIDTRTVSRDSSDNTETLLGTALFFGLGDDPSVRDEFFATTLTQARATGADPHLTIVHDHQVYTYTRPTKNPNNLILGSTPCGALLVLADDDHAAAALWRRLAEPPAER